MASLRVLAFDHEGTPVQFDTWLDDLQLYLLSDSKDSVSLFDLASGAAAAPPATADSSTRSQWLTRVAAARLAIHNHLPLAECAHFGQYRIAQALYDAVTARYSSPATDSLGRLLLPYLLPELFAFTTVEDLVSHLCANDDRYRAAVLAEFLDRNPPPMYITLYFTVTRLPDSLRSVRDHFLSLDPTSLTVDLLEQHLLAAETSAVAVGAARGTPCPPFFEGCSPSPLAPSYASDAAADVSVPEDVGAASASAKRRSSKGKGGRGGGGGSGGGGGGSGSGGGGSSGGGGGGETVGGSGGSGGNGGGSGGSGGSGGGGTVSGGTGARRIAAAALGASESGTLPGTAPAEALHTFTLDSGALRCFFCDSTTLTPLPAPVPVRLADPSGGPVVTRSSTVLPCPAVSSSSLSGLHVPLFSTNLVVASALVSASGQVAASCSCRLLSHQTLLWHHRLGHPSLACLRGMHSRLLVSGLPKSLPPLPPLPAPPCLPCVEGRQRATPHSSSFPPTTAPLQTLHMDVKGQIVDLLIPWIRTVRLQLRKRFGQDLPILRLHSDKGGEFSSTLLREFCRGEGILQSFTLPDSPRQNGIAEHRIGLVMEVARTSMIHAAAPHFLWPFAVQYAEHELILWPRVSLPKTSPSLRWTGEVGDESVFRVWGSLTFVRDTSANTLSPRAIPCVFLGFVPDAPGWQFYHPTSRPVFSSQDVTFDESVPFYRLFPYRSAPPPPPLPLFLALGPPPVDPLPPQGPAPSGVSQVHPLPGPAPVQVVVGSGAARGAASGGVEPGGAESEGAETRGPEHGGVETGGVETGGAEPGGVATGGAEPGGVAIVGAEPWGARSEGAKSGGAEPQGAASSGGSAGASPRLSPQQLREWFVWRTRLRIGAFGAGGAGVAGAGGAGVAACAGVTGATMTTGTGGARTWGTGAAGTGGVEGAGAGVLLESGTTGAGGAGAGGAGVGGPDFGGAGAGGARAVDPGGAVRPRPYFVPLLQQVLGTPSSTGLTPPLLCPPPDQSQPPLQPASPLPAPSPYTEQSGGLAERRELASPPVLPVRTSRRVPRSRPPPVPGTHTMTLRPSTVPLCVLLPAPPESSLPDSAAASVLVAELLDFAAACRLEYATALVAESTSASPPSDGGECALGTDVLEDRQEDFESLTAAVPRFASMLLAPEGDPDAPDIPTPCTYAEAITAHRSYRAACTRRSSCAAHLVSLSLFLQILSGAFSGQSTVSAKRLASSTRTTLAALGFAPATADPSLLLLTDTLLPPFYVLVYVDDLIFATADTEALTLVKLKLQKRHTYTDLGPSALRLPVLLATANSSVYQPLALSSTFGQVHRAEWSIPRACGLPHVPDDVHLTRPRVPSQPPCSLLGSRQTPKVVLTGHADASWVDDSATQRSSQGYTFSLGSGSVSRRSTYLSSVLSSSCEAEIYAGAMAAQELRWHTYLLTDLGEQPCSPPRGQLRLAYVATRANTADVFTKALPLGDHQRFVTVLGRVPTLPHLLTA
ncbi:unnamed protein product [Closterium sp. NIES-53]